MGNRIGNPPSRDDDEESDSQPSGSETSQTSIPDTTPPESEEEDSSDEKPDDTSIDGPIGTGGGGGVPVDVPTNAEPDEEPKTTDSENEEEEGESETEPDNQDDTDEEEEEFTFVYGDIVRDREEKVSEDEVPKDLVVVYLPEETISEWVCGEDETLAERNPGYPPTDNVVAIVEMKILDEKIPKWDEREEEISLETLDENDIHHDCYPSLRLLLQELSHLRAV